MTIQLRLAQENSYRQREGAWVQEGEGGMETYSERLYCSQVENRELLSRRDQRETTDLNDTSDTSECM